MYQIQLLDLNELCILIYEQILNEMNHPEKKINSIRIFA
jgi:hypothetical protein